MRLATVNLTDSLRVVLDTLTLAVKVQEHCGPYLDGNHVERFYWHGAGHTSLAALHWAAQGGAFRFRRIGQRCGRGGHRPPTLTVEQIRALLVKLDEQQGATP